MYIKRDKGRIKRIVLDLHDVIADSRSRGGTPTWRLHTCAKYFEKWNQKVETAESKS